MANKQKYNYKGTVVTEKAVYGGGVVMIELPDGRREAVPASSLEPLGPNTILDASAVLEAKPTLPKESVEQEKEQAIIPNVEAKLNINLANQSDIADLKGVGRSSAKRIIANRPPHGYKDIDQLRGLNSELTRLDWDVLTAQVTFS